MATVVPMAQPMVMAPAVAGQVIGTGAMMGQGLMGVAQILGPHSDIHIRQHVPKMAVFEGACCEIRNKYFVTAGSDGQGERLLEAAEHGSCLDRTCCKPYHSRTLYVYPVGSSKEQSVLTIDHPGIECMICSAPKPCLGECALMDCCLDGVNVYDGYVDGQAGHLSGNLISAIKMPPGGGGCTPTLVVSHLHNQGPVRRMDDNAYIEGPTCFGGWSECCVDSKFTYSTAKGGAGDIATFKHLKPKDCGGALREACTDSDNFGVTFAAGATAEQKADALSAAILVDYVSSTTPRASSSAFASSLEPPAPLLLLSSAHRRCSSRRIKACATRRTMAPSSAVLASCVTATG